MSTSVDVNVSLWKEKVVVLHGSLNLARKHVTTREWFTVVIECIVIDCVSLPLHCLCVTLKCVL